MPRADVDESVKSDSTGLAGEHMSDLWRAALRRVRHLLRGEAGDPPAVQDDRPFGYSIRVSDWPVGRADYDLTASEAIRALEGLGDYYEAAMRSLRETEVPAEEVEPEPARDSEPPAPAETS